MGPQKMVSTVFFLSCIDSIVSHAPSEIKSEKSIGGTCNQKYLQVLEIFKN